MTSEKDRVSALIKEFGGTQSAFAKHIGVGQSAIANWIKRDSIPATAKAQILSCCDGISERWLFFGEGNMFQRGTNMFYRELEVSAGRIEFFNTTCKPERIYIPGVEAEGFFPVKGFSMYPTIQEGDIVGVVQVDDLETINPQKIYLIITRDNERMLKHIDMGKANSPYITLTSDNEKYEPFKIKKENVLSIYKVIFHGRNHR
ncbi:MAG: LexA family transcriptional regulator [Muribaculaceae bacterium]|nr:LexA family transcriptional regulator [Muribaculaceae bacterium]